MNQRIYPGCIVNRFIIVLLTLSFFISLNLYADEKEDSYGLEVVTSSSEKRTETPKEKSRIGCRSQEDSYNRYVKPVKDYSKRDEDSLKKHLECWKDRDVMIKLARIYVKRKQFYLAKQVYKEAGMQKEIQLVEQLIKKAEKPEDRQKFMQQSLKIAGKLRKKATELKQLGITFSIIGPLFAGAGFGLFLHDKAFNGSNSPTAQYSLMFSGLSLLAGGLTMNYFAEYKRAIADTYIDIANNNYEAGATPTQYYEFSGKEAQTRKKMIKKLRAHGASLLALSAPLIIISTFSMIDAYNWVAGGNSIFDIDDFLGAILYGVLRIEFVIIGEILTLVPGMVCLIAGFNMIVRSYEWESTDKPKSALTLNSITPMINPITRSYGISVGFSF